jgi:hypothetical protein
VACVPAASITLRSTTTSAPGFGARATPSRAGAAVARARIASPASSSTNVTATPRVRSISCSNRIAFASA